MKIITVMFMAVWLSACTHTTSANHSSFATKTAGTWALLPFKNLAETPKAAERAESITRSLLFAKGYQVTHYPAQNNDDLVLLLDDNKRVENAKKWAEQQGYRYAITGDVTEWRYKTGLDADPSVAISIRILDLQSSTVIYNQSGSKVGWGYSNLSSTAQGLIQKLLANM